MSKMFRRSNSSSNIPIPKVNVFVCKDTRVSRRSQSVSRLSQRDSAASTSLLKQPRKSSLEGRSSNLLGLTKATPRTGRAGSLQRTTPTSALSQRTNKSITPSSSRKGHKTIQKLANDKKWVAEQYIKVQNFIMCSSLFDLNKVNINSLKPPTINTFIYVTAVLFKEISPKIKIGNDNYKEVVPAQLKVLKYPSTLSNSVLKTVNTLHSWPQVVSMWSWLIDKINITRCVEDEPFLEYLEPEEKQKYLLRKNCMDYLARRYDIFNTYESNTEKIQEANDLYVNNLVEILGVDSEKFQKLEAAVLEKREFRKKQEAEIEILNMEKSKIESEIEYMKNEIADFYATDAIKEKDLDSELEILNINLSDIRNRNAALKKDVKELEIAKQLQPCTYQDKVNLLHEIDQLKEDIRLKREKIEHAQNIKSKFDYELAKEIDKIQGMVIQWNRSLMELSIKKPELKKLLLRERGFNNPEFLNELQEVLNHKITVEKEITKALLKVENDLKLKEEKKQKLEENIAEFIRAVDLIKQESLKLSENIVRIKQEMKNLLLDLEEKKKSYNQQMKDLQENTECEEQKKIISELKNKRDNLQVEVKDFAQKMLHFFLELQDQIINNIKEMDSVRASVTSNYRDRALSMIEKQQQLIDVLESFDKTE